jgi:hypothetical protein
MLQVKSNAALFAESPTPRGIGIGGGATQTVMAMHRQETINPGRQQSQQQRGAVGAAAETNEQAAAAEVVTTNKSLDLVADVNHDCS